MHQYSTITIDDLQLEYLEMGSGHEVIICLHGFGREASDFETFKSLLQPNQRLVAINLFAHGRSVFPKNRLNKDPLLVEEWCAIIKQLMNTLHISRFHLMGYSMGGRIAMVMMQHMPDCIRSLTLIAPDGLKVNMLYRFVSETALGRVIFRRIIRNPKWLLQLADIFKVLRIMNDKLHRFVYVQLESEVKRQLVYDVWLTHRKFFPELSALASHIQKKHTPLVLIFGAYDAVIPPRLATKLTRYFTIKPQLHITASGHLLLTQETVQLLAQEQPWSDKP